MSATDIASLPLKYLDKAVNGLRDLGLMPAKANEALIEVADQPDQLPR